MKRIKNSRMLLKILSGAIAIVLWFAITYTEDPIINQSLANVNLIFEGERELNKNGLVIVNKDNIAEISVVVRGNRSNVISSLGAVNAVADVSKITQEGTNDVDITYNYPSNGITLIKTKTKQVKIETERLVIREIPVRLEEVHREKNDVSIVESICKTNVVTISGAENTVYKIAYAKAQIDTGNVQKSGVHEYIYKLYDEKDNLISEENIINKSRDTVRVENIVYKRMELPIKVVLNDTQRKDYGFVVKNMDKKTISAGVLDEVAPEYLEAVVVISDNTDKQVANIVVPEGVYIPEEYRTIQVTGEILAKELKEMTVLIEAENVPQGKRAIIEPQEKVITVKTAEKDPKIKATVDFGSIEHEQMAKVNLETNTDVEIIGTYSVMVNLEAGE